MTREEKCKLAIKKGYKYDPETGLVTGIRYNKPIKTTLKGYKILSFRYNKKNIRISHHQFAWFYIYGYCPNLIDHINLDILDNRIENLRILTKSLNGLNNKAKGIQKKRNGKYIACIKRDYKNIHLGYHKTEEKAINAYQKAKKIIFENTEKSFIEIKSIIENEVYRPKKYGRT